MKALFLIQGGVSLLLTLIGLLLWRSTQGAISVAVGSCLVTLLLGISAWAWRNIFSKKLVALSFVVIVIKYAVLILIIHQVVKTKNIEPAGFALGVASLVMSALIYVLLMAKRGNDAL